ncbi:predicted protein [Sclerotinia sclerotiorum 1980 UF-70]|uniref:Uncharacterized protein n=1 Tax=Sclerotinia sclerotiorum (strain ATCC 18683 / 1980 / Ss-1) TaxID=665079 RepID=A7EMM8_SCLS1|nr:predicted protein [Sclerotinia sclerotiorum 1980 UF-70]EDO04094.1 predicted protein [Sclerotinia sclerotiorum 1980 UF-70]
MYISTQYQVKDTSNRASRRKRSIQRASNTFDNKKYNFDHNREEEERRHIPQIVANMGGRQASENNISQEEKSNICCTGYSMSNQYLSSYIFSWILEHKFLSPFPPWLYIATALGSYWVS